MARSAAQDAVGEFQVNLEVLLRHLSTRHNTLSDLPTLPDPDAIKSAISALPARLPDSGQGTSSALTYLLKSILPGCLQAQNGPNYFGFVTGGVTPAAQLADILVGAYDENVQVTLPGQTAATAVEVRVLELVLDLMDVERDRYLGRTITTGATASNILGMACAREFLYANSPHLSRGYSYARSGPPSSATLPNPPIAVLALHPHYSILKAAALVGIGSGPDVVHSMPCREDNELAFDLVALEERLRAEKAIGRGVVLAYGLGEVNTGGFGRDLRKVAGLCKRYGAWLHVDGAFGGFASVVPELRYLVDGIELADSLTLDGHKWLNVPYDCGLFYTRSPIALQGIFAPPEAPAYLAPDTSTAVVEDTLDGRVQHDLVPSPLYVNIENSRRFRALPLLASLMSLGKQGYTESIRRNVEFARSIATYIAKSDQYDLLNPSPTGVEGIIPLNVVLFAPSSSMRIKDGAELTNAINNTRKMYVTGTKWRGRSAVRLAVSNWRTGTGGEAEVQRITGILDEVARAGQ